MRFILKPIAALLLPVVLILSLASCSSTKKIKYFQDIPDSGQIKIIAGGKYIEPKVQVDDILTIIIQTVDTRATQEFNSGNIASPNNGSIIGSVNINQQTTAGYLVNKSGDVDLPTIGYVKVVGYTTTELKEVILEKALRYYKNPTVIVRYANFKVSVAGEVSRPGTYIMPNEKVSILDAITIAGDLTIYGKRDNILLLRENADGTKSAYRINLKKSESLSSPYYYLRQNDYIYVEPATAKAAATDASRVQYFALASSLLSVIIVIVSRF